MPADIWRSQLVMSPISTGGWKSLITWTESCWLFSVCWKKVCVCIICLYVICVCACVCVLVSHKRAAAAQLARVFFERQKWSANASSWRCFPQQEGDGNISFSVGWWAKVFSYPMKKQLTAVVIGFPALRCISWRACLFPAVAGVLGWAHRCSWLGSRRLCHDCKGGWASWSCWKGTWALNCWEKRMIRSMWKKFIFFKTEQNWRLERWKVGGTMCRERMREN